MKRIARCARNIALAAVGLLGFPSCLGGGMTVMYGMPASMYGMPPNYGVADVHGTVTDSAGNGIPGIRVRALLGGEEYGSCLTGSDGSYVLEVSGGEWDTAYTLVFEDVDGAANGSFSAEEMEVQFEGRNDSVERDVRLKEAGE